MTYYSQDGQDKFLDYSVFKGMEEGIFVDVGAYDGVEFSNSLFFEKYRKWTGVCIEPNPVHFESLKKRNCIVEKVAVSEKEEELDFFANTGYTCGLSGLKDFYPQEHLSRLQKENLEMGSVTKNIKVQSVPLQKILDKNGVDYVHYLSIDVEGGELSVLKSLDFEKTFVDVIGFEANYPKETIEILQFLKKRGYRPLKEGGLDYFMIHENSVFL